MVSLLILGRVSTWGGIECQEWAWKYLALPRPVGGRSLLHHTRGAVLYTILGRPQRGRPSPRPGPARSSPQPRPPTTTPKAAPAPSHSGDARPPWLLIWHLLNQREQGCATSSPLIRTPISSLWWAISIREVSPT